MRILACALPLILIAFQSLAQGYDTRARAIYVLDQDSNTVLLEKNAQEPFPPASMSKLMTLYMLFEALQEGRLGLTSQFPVSEKAWKMGGSKMFLKAGDMVSVEDLIRGIIIQSGNDACVVVAEGLAGSEAEFANRMTKRAREIGLKNSTFANSSGWPHPDQRMSAEDLALLAGMMVQKFPEYYGYFKERSFEWEGIDQGNRNPLLALDIGADGLKTGHTEEAGYGLVGSAVQDDRRIVFVIMGLSSVQQRSEESQRVVGWAFREFTSETLFKAQQVVATAQVWLGASDTIDLVPDEDLSILIPYAERREITAKVRYQGPVEAPIAKGDAVADLIIEIPSLSDQHFPLYAAEDVGKGGFLDRMIASAQLLSQKVYELAASNGQ